MTSKIKKEASSLPKKDEAKVEDLQVKESVWKDGHIHQRKNCTFSSFLWPKILTLRATQTASENAPRRKTLDIIKFPVTAMSAVKEREDKETPVFIVNVKANKPQIKQEAL
ncbi:60S ribosomal protein L23a-like [Sorex araneus]|uniref:60S ribosomal protein L23a-like n=1 Tax=Sorex araneus TaxID=42254 RepID=UPI0024339BB8|nr:60S ribosomal protein L23a-like [Sorex araneus]